MDLTIDPGNALVKAVSLTQGIDDWNYRHSMAELSDSDWNRIVGRNAPPDGIAAIRDGRTNYMVAFGDAAMRHQPRELPRGSARYARDYIGLIVAYTAGKIIGNTSKARKVNLTITYAPQDHPFADDLVAAVEGEWEVLTSDGYAEIIIQNIHTTLEPYGGYSHVVLTKDGKERRKNPLSNKQVIVIDVGGFTVDTVAIDASGEIDHLSAASTETGVINMTKLFVDDLRNANREVFRGARALDPRRVEKALMEGRYMYGNRPIDCESLALDALYTLGNEVRGIVDSQGGPGNYDIALVTGGGSALLYNVLSDLMPVLDFWPAERDLKMLHMANALGASKLTLAMRNTGLWK